MRNDEDLIAIIVLLLAIVTVGSFVSYTVGRNDTRKQECEYWNQVEYCVDVGGHNYHPVELKED